MPALAEVGYHDVAPDQRGYGRTTGWNPDYDGDLGSFRLLNLVRDVLGLLDTIGHARFSAVVGHDFGASVAAWCALLRPDIFHAVALMSAPLAVPPRLRRPPQPDIHAALAALPRPHKHYQWYYSTCGADTDMRHAAQGLHDFLRGYYHHKSADWPGNRPHPLTSWTAEELAKLPTYYIMDLGADMAATVAAEMPNAAQVAACRWLPEAELAVYAAEYTRTGFQGGLQWYHCRTSGRFDAELEVFAGRSIDLPSCFISGAADWGIHQVPVALERMQATACTRMAPVALIQGAGHWVQQEQPDAVVRCLLGFLGRPVQP